MKRLLIWLIVKVNHASFELFRWLTRKPKALPCPWTAWARHWGDGRNHWEPIARRPTEDLCWTCAGQYLDRHPDTSVCVLPGDMRPEDPPPMCQPAEGDAP